MDPKGLLRAVRALRREVEAAADRYLTAWGLSPPYPLDLHNLARYLALRRRELRPLQRALMVHGLSSLGRAESRVAETLLALENALAALAGEGAYPGGRTRRASSRGRGSWRPGPRPSSAPRAPGGEGASWLPCPGRRPVRGRW